MVGYRAFRRYLNLLGTAAPQVEGPWPEQQQSDYESGTVRMRNELWRLRTARVTPKKPGGFVAVWQRNDSGKPQPLNVSDSCNGLYVFVEEADSFGVFIFTSARLVELGVYRSENSPGKHGFRVYPSWSIVKNRQAERTQQQQAGSFTLLAT